MSILLCKIPDYVALSVTNKVYFAFASCKRDLRENSDEKLPATFINIVVALK